jgi:hypothetical protein
MPEPVEGANVGSEPSGAADPHDPERLLGELPEESPPPEIVLAAVRVFRYRALLALVLVIALSVIGVLLAQRYLGPVTTDDLIAAVRHDGGTTTLGLEQEVGGVHVLLWEIVSDRDVSSTGYLHIEAWDADAVNIQLRVTSLQVGGRVAPAFDFGSSGSCCPSSYESWVRFEAPNGIGSTLGADVEVYAGPVDGSAQPLIGTLHFSSSPQGGQG